MGLQSVAECIALWRSRKGTSPAISDGERTLDWAELDALSNRFARAYEERGVGAGDLVAIALPNVAEFYLAALAVWKLGATPLPLSTRMAETERTVVLEVAGPRIVIDDAVAALIEHDADRYSDAPVEPRVASNWKAIASGGSTGRPKIIVAEDPALFDPDEPPFLMTRDQIHLVAGPLFHNAAFLFSMRALFCGARIVVMRKFDAEEALAQIERERATYTVMVPTMMQRIAKLPDEVHARYDLSSLQVLLHTGAACAPWLKRWWIDRIGGDAVQEVFGVTEGCGSCWVSGTEWLERPGSAGKPMPGFKMRITGPDGLELPVGEIGDIYVMPESGPGSTYHYLGGTSRRDSDGWEWMGDMGHADADGYIYVADRRTDLIISGGANIYPAEVEAAIDGFRGVRSSAVIGLPDDDLGQRVHAVVDAPGGLDQEALLAHLAQQLTRYKIPRSIEWVGEPVRNEAGKVRRSALRAERQEKAA